MPPAAAMAASNRSHSASASRARPSSTCVRARGTFAGPKKCRSMKAR